MRKEAKKQIISFAFDAWLDHVEAQGQGAAEQTSDTVRQCGAWIILRRNQLGLTSAMVCERTGLEAGQLTLLESGIASNAGLPDEALYRLCLVLENEHHDLDRVAAVVYLALGNPVAAEDRTAEWVASELAAAYDDVAATSQALPAFELDDAQYYVLATCENGALNAIGIRSAAAEFGKATKLELPTIWSVTRELVARNILIEINDPGADLPRYCITEPLGREILRIEQESRTLRQRKLQLDDTQRKLDEDKRKLQQTWGALSQGTMPPGAA